MSSLAAGSSYLLAAVLAGDAIMSIKPPKFISKCLTGVGYPRDWWWTLIRVKSIATIGLIYGAAVANPSITTTVSAGVVSYFIFAAAAHIRARFTGTEFWINCLGMLGLSTAVTVVNAISM